MGGSLGANDAANIFGTGIASKLISFRNAMVMLSIFVVLGAVLEGPKCMKSLGELGALDLNQAFICTMAAAITMIILTIYAIPASTSQAIVGAIVGSMLVDGSPNYMQLLKMFICWVFTPIGAAIIAYLIYRFTDFLVSRYIKSIRGFENFVRITFLISGCYGSYALGANNVANSTGVYVNAGLLDPRPAALYGGIAIALGAILFSKKVIYTVGAKITLIGPLGALISTLAHSITVHIYTQIGVPVSSSQAIVGAVIGIGLVRGIRAVNFRILAKIGIGWIMTPLSSGLITWIAVFFWS